MIKRLLILISILFVFVNLAYSQPENLQKKDIIKGNVKELEILFSNTDKFKDIESKIIKEFNKENEMVKYEILHFNPSMKKHNRKIIYETISNYNIPFESVLYGKKHENFNYEGKLISIYKSYYNNEKLIIYENYTSSEEISQRDIYEYNKQGDKIKHSITKPDVDSSDWSGLSSISSDKFKEVSIYTYEYKYDKNNNILQKEQYINNKFSRKSIFTYDDKKNQLSEKVFDSNDNIFLEHQYKYDNSNNIIQWTRIQYNKEDEISSKNIVKYQYNKDGNVIFEEQLFYDTKDKLYNSIFGKYNYKFW